MTKKIDPKFMRAAITAGRRNLQTLDGGPFGACIVRNGRILATSRNTVLKSNDATCHAEINALRAASKKVGSYDLSGCVAYSTTEPCPMCFSALHWARIDTVIYGTSIKDVKKRGFNELPIKNTAIKREGKSRIKIIPRFLYGECLQLLKDWDKLEKKIIY